MCGVFGYIGKPDKETPRVLIHLMVLNEDRGKDSAGIVVASDNGIKMYKKAVNAMRFIGHSKTINVLAEVANKPWVTVIGHTRAATMGIVSDKNAHPFHIGKLYFAHNGMINNFQELQKEYQTNYQVDSQILGHLIREVGVKVTLQEKVKGWFALPYFNSDNPTRLYVAKHTSPLTFAYLPNNEGVYYSSQKDHLVKALGEAKIKGCRIAEKTTSKIHVLTWDGVKVIRESEKLTCLPYEFYSYAPSVSNYGGVSWKNGDWVEQYQTEHDKRQDWYERWYNRTFKIDE